MSSKVRRPRTGFTRRDVFRNGGITAAGLLAGAVPASAATAKAAEMEPPPDVYTRLGVQPFINCTATLTRNGGSRLLPEVIETIEHASFYHVEMDAVMEAAGRRIAELTGAEWAMVSSGAAAALTHSTAACVAGTDPERMMQLPDLRGLKNEVIMPRSSRNTYDNAIRAVGVKIVEVNSEEELKAAISHNTAMIAVLGNRFDEVRLPLKKVGPIAKQAGIPVLVDAAADYLIRPNPYIAEGADLVAYSGGKILRGPQTAGLLLGREDLVRAAFANSAPHHSFGRPMKVSKEEIVGIVRAVEVWFENRDLKAEYKEWRGWYDHISREVTKVDGVQAIEGEPSRGGPFPTLKIEWDFAQVGLTSQQVHERLMSGDPPIMTHAGGPGHSLRIRPVAMKPNEYKTVASRLHEIFRGAPKGSALPDPAPPKSNISGRWDVDVAFALGEARHHLFLEADGNEVTGTHIGTANRGTLRGTIDGDKVLLRSTIRYEGSRLSYAFEGTVSGSRMSGELDLGEHPRARWTATRHEYGQSARKDPSDSGKA